MNKTVQAKNIPDDLILEAIDEYAKPWALIWDIENYLCAYPRKVVLAKLRILLKRQVIDGCGCGCRGDFRRYVNE